VHAVEGADKTSEMIIREVLRGLAKS